MTNAHRIPIFDFHTHVYPLPEGPRLYQNAKAMLRRTLNPFTESSQFIATSLRKAPLWLRKGTEELSTGYLLSHLLLEGSWGDLKRSTEHSSIDGLLLVAHPPLIPNSFVSTLTQNEKSWIPAWQFPFRKNESVQSFRDQMKEQQVRVLKIHPMSDGRGAEDEIYIELIKTAQKEGWLVVLHSGRVSSHGAFRDPSLGELGPFMSWFQRFPGIQFVVAHLNIHEPEAILSRGAEFKNVSWTLSWQPESVMEQALEKLPLDRLLFASDWPLLGGNQQVQKRRLERALEKAALSENDETLIWSGNAVKLLKESGAWKGAW